MDLFGALFGGPGMGRPGMMGHQDRNSSPMSFVLGDPGMGKRMFDSRPRISRDDKTITVRVALPGLDPESINVQVFANHLTIEAKKKSGDECKCGDGCDAPDSIREFCFIGYNDSKKARASYIDGVLTIEIPRETGYKVPVATQGMEQFTSSKEQQSPEADAESPKSDAV